MVKVDIKKSNIKYLGINEICNKLIFKDISSFKRYKKNKIMMK
jgi:hypothetical protein